jgi:hypothetical protein
MINTKGNNYVRVQTYYENVQAEINIVYTVAGNGWATGVRFPSGKEDTW